MPNNFPTISVLMSVYNEQESWLREAIESILNQTYTDFEFIIILDNPENEMAKRVIREYIETDKRVVFLENEVNLGAGPSKNRGLEIARGQYVAIMDADDISLPERFVKQIEFMENNPEIDLVGSWAQRIDECGNIIGIIKNLNNPILLKKITPYRMPAFHPTWLLKAKIFKTLKGGAYRNTFTVCDYEIIMRIIEHGFKISNIQEHLLSYRIRLDSISQKNSLHQVKASKYLVKLHKKRLITGIDTFNNDDLQKATKSTFLTKYMHSKSTYYFILSTKLKNNNKNIIAIFFLILSFVLSPYWMCEKIYRSVIIKKLTKNNKQ